MSEAYHTAYRPTVFEDVIGQKAVVSALRQLVKKNTSHGFLLAGPAGTGKTTLARITASNLKCTEIVEFDAATHTGIEDVRNLQEMVRFRPFSGGNKAFIIDEAHGLSKQAWNALLKVTEEPPAHVYFFLCTTEPGKVPKTVASRFSKFTLKPVGESELTELVEWVAGQEGLKPPSDIVHLIVKEAQGSPRQALVNLASVGHMTNKQEAASVLQSAVDSDPVIEFCRFVMQPGSWLKAMTIVGKLDDMDPESVRIVACNYLAKVAMGAKDDKGAVRTLRLLEAFSTPYNRSDGKAPLLLSLGRSMFAD